MFEKKNSILFNDRGKSIDKSIKINGTEMERFEKTKFLGVIIDKDLSWKSHINYISD